MKEIIQTSIYKKNLNYVKWGIIFCVLAAVPYGAISTFQTFSTMEEPFASLSALSLLMVPFIIAALQDYLSAITVFIKNLQAGKQREYIRSIVTKPARYFVLASVFGGPVALGCYCASILFCGPVYSVAITAILPAVGALMSRVFLKEKISSRGWIGIALCVIGPLMIGWEAPTSEQYPLFYLGIIFAIITAFGWGGEIVVSVAGMDFIDPEVAIGIRFIFSGTFSLAIVPIAAAFSGISGLKAFGYFFTSLTTVSGLWLIPAAIIAGLCYMCYYKGANAAGAARAVAINPLWAVTATALGIIVWHTNLTWNFFIGLAILLFGGILAIGKPVDIFTLRDVEGGKE